MYMRIFNTFEIDAVFLCGPICMFDSLSSRLLYALQKQNCTQVEVMLEGVLQFEIFGNCKPYTPCKIHGTPKSWTESKDFPGPYGDMFNFNMFN